MARRVYALDPHATERTIRAVRRWEQRPDDERDQRRTLEVLGQQNSLAWVYCTNATADADGRYAALWSSYDEETNTWTNEEDCYLRKGINTVGIPVANKRYLGRREGSHPDDGLPVYVPLLFDDSIGDTVGGGFPYAGAAAQVNPTMPPLTLVNPGADVEFAMEEIFDTDDFYVVGSGEFIIPADFDGKYQMGGFCLWHATAASAVERSFKLRVEVTTSPHYDTYDAAASFHTFGASATYGFRQHVVSPPIALAEGDMVRLLVSHTSSSPESVGYGQFWINRVDNEY